MPKTAQAKNVFLRPSVRHALYLGLFLLWVVPLEFHLDWFNLLRAGIPLEESMLQPLTRGILYFCGLTLAAENLLVISMYLVKYRQHNRAVLWAEIGSALLLSFCFLVISTTPKSHEGPPSFLHIQEHWLIRLEFFTCLCAMLMSFLVHGMAAHQHSKVVR